MSNRLLGSIIIGFAAFVASLVIYLLLEVLPRQVTYLVLAGVLVGIIAYLVDAARDAFKEDSKG